MRHLVFLLRQVYYDVNVNLFVRPGLMTVALAALAVLDATYDTRLFQALRVSPRLLFPGEPAAAQLVLATVAGLVMTVVSIVYSVLLMALSLASVQFSPRILAGFVRDRVSQHTLGLFIGTFVYALVMLRAVHGDPEPFVPALGVTLAVALAIISLASLVFFIHHMALGIDQLGDILGHIARRPDRARVLTGSVGKGVVVPRWSSFEDCLDLALTQIRQYGQGDVAVLLRLLRVSTDLARATADPSRLERTARHARAIRRHAEKFPALEIEEFGTRWEVLRRRLAERDVDIDTPASLRHPL